MGRNNQEKPSWDQPGELEKLYTVIGCAHSGAIGREHGAYLETFPKLHTEPSQMALGTYGQLLTTVRTISYSNPGASSKKAGLKIKSHISLVVWKTVCPRLQSLRSEWRGKLKVTNP